MLKVSQGLEFISDWLNEMHSVLPQEIDVDALLKPIKKNGKWLVHITLYRNCPILSSTMPIILRRPFPLVKYVGFDGNLDNLDDDSNL